MHTMQHGLPREAGLIAVFLEITYISYFNSLLNRVTWEVQRPLDYLRITTEVIIISVAISVSN